MGGMTFGEAYDAYKQDIRVSALSQKVPGLDYDDVVSEMLICLWKATETYKTGTGTSFGAYWWSLWLNRRSDIASSWHATKRIHPVLSDEPLVEGQYEDRPMVNPPGEVSAQDRMVWDLLATGASAADTMRAMSISRRRYYSTVRDWRTKTVYETLRDA